MSKVKKQHFVPRFYLRRFADPNDRISVFDKFTQSGFLSNIKDVASGKYFYDLTQEVIDELQEQIASHIAELDFDEDFVNKLKQHISDAQIIEKQLSKFEDRSAKVLDRVFHSLERRHRFKNKYRSELALFMALQFWRTQEQRESMLELDNAFEEQVMRIVNRFNEVNGTNYTAKELEIDFDPDETTTRHKMMMFDWDTLQETANILQNHIWVIGVNETSQPLYTSDNPIARRAHKKDDWRSNSGIASPGIEMVFPLSPKYILMLYERSYHSQIEAWDSKLKSLKPDNVTYYNSLQVDASYRQIYSYSGNFDLAIEMCQKLPELTDPHRPRWGFQSGLGATD